MPFDSNHGDKRPRLDDSILDIPLLYYLATSAHTSSSLHLKQAFFPLDLKPTSGSILPDRDPYAAEKCMDLLVLSLDLLRLGLARDELSDKERAAFACEYAVVGYKTISALSHVKRDIDGRALLLDIQAETRQGASVSVFNADDSSLDAKPIPHSNHFTYDCSCSTYEVCCFNPAGTKQDSSSRGAWQMALIDHIATRSS